MKKKIRKKNKIFGSSERPRLVVFRSHKYIYGQIVDDSMQKTLLGASSLTKQISDKIKKAKSKVEESRVIGQYIAERAKSKKIKTVIFDRNGYTYHGRVKGLAEGAREGGLKF